MDLKTFYQQMRQVEATLIEKDAVVVSLETPDGGRAGVTTEVNRSVAARMIVERKARLATPGEVTAFHEQRAEAQKTAEQLANAARLQITVISDSELRALKNSTKRT